MSKSEITSRGLGKVDQAEKELNAHLQDLTEQERAVVDLFREKQDETELLFNALEVLRANNKLDVLDALYNSALSLVQRDHGVMSIWCSVPRIRRDSVEALRRAELMARTFPSDAKACNHMIFALHASRGYDYAMSQVAIWLDKLGDHPDITGPAATIALYEGHWAVAEELFQKEKGARRTLDVGTWRQLIITMIRQDKIISACQELREALSLFPQHPELIDLLHNEF